MLSDEKDITNAINDVFVNVGPNLDEDIKNPTCSYFDFHGPYLLACVSYFDIFCFLVIEKRHWFYILALPSLEMVGCEIDTF